MCLCLLSSFFSKSNKCSIVAGEATSKRDQQNETPPFKCNLYLAPSSIPNAGFGVYTTRDIQPNEPITPYADTPSIIVTDVEAHSENFLGDYWSHIEYFWTGEGLAEFESNEISENVFVLGCLCNYHTYLKNIYPLAVAYDDTYLDRFQDPGAGAFSYHEGHRFIATNLIQAGEELFADYGENWLDTREGTFADYIPRKSDYRKATHVIQAIHKRLQDKNTLTDAAVSLLVDIVNIFENRVGSILPKTSVDYNTKIFSHSEQKRMERKLADKTLLERNITWIEENGICLELIRTGKSTIKQAGRGAFAQTFIENGSILSPAPLNTIVDRDMLLMYDLMKDDETEEMLKKDDVPIGHQLILNYCFGHQESSMLLCPMSNSILINHCSVRNANEGHCDDRGPNAKIAWATNWDSTTSSWLQKSLDEIKTETEEGVRGLSFEIIATRDIEPGEEVFIDYGEGWEKAWSEHVENWKPPDETSNYISVRSMNDSHDYRTIDELKTNPYPENVQLVCFCNRCDSELEGYDDEDLTKLEIELDGNRFIPKHGVDAEHKLFPCEIVEKPFSSYFTVRIQCPSGLKFIVKMYPKKSLTFRMKELKSDQHLRGAFRHFIEIEDELFPEKWKDKLS